ncbi:hypothetical protein ACFVHB_36035 [Kitasatospora sp. NPDC127111]|uniref:hypothetical protein n=1 Tax=Kitasatospora sp. NPDC127111 TaxID=3345363 RepID=UPI003632A53B
MIALIVAAVLAISVSANAVTRGKPAQKNSVATVTMAKVVASGEWLCSREVAAIGQRFGQQLAILSAADVHQI